MGQMWPHRPAQPEFRNGIGSGAATRPSPRGRVDDRGVDSLMSIGDFSRATRLSAKALRFYHQVGILAPARIEPGNGYRLYGVEQIADAQLIRTYRSLDMPIDLIRSVLSTPGGGERDLLIREHLASMEAQLEAKRSAIVSLRRILEPTPAPFAVEHRAVPPLPAVIISETIDLADLSAWYEDTLRDLDRVVASGVHRDGARGGIWDTELFLNERGSAALYFPISSLDVAAQGRARVELLPPVDLVVARHVGTDDTVAAVYAELGRYVAEHEVSADGPIRETYLTEPTSTIPEAITEIGWPVIRQPA